MKILILAAGYGTRLARDLEQTGRFPELKGVPKPLLPVAGRPLVSHWVEAIRGCPELAHCDIYVVVNDANHALFAAWAEGQSQVQLVSDGTKMNEERLGAVKCIELAVKHFKITDHLIVVGGDLLFYNDFTLSVIVEKFFAFPCVQGGGALVTTYKCGPNETTRFGILEVDKNGCVTSFLEKPSPKETTSRQACPCFYVLSEDALPLLSQFLKENESELLIKRDAPGNFIRYLCSKRSVYTHEVTGRFDIGNLESYVHCIECFKP